MTSTLPARTGLSEKPVFIPPKRRTASGKSSAGAATPTRSIYGDQILLVQGRGPGSTDCLVDPQQPAAERDVLGSLERFPSGSVGTLRSNGSIPTLERVRREISNHSIGSHSQTSSGQVSERSTDIDLVREAVHTKRSRRTAAVAAARHSESSSRLSRSTSRSSQPASTRTSSDDLDKVSVVAAEDRVGNIQSRPLPSPPDGETPSRLKIRVNPEDEAIEILTSENVSLGGPRLNVSLKPPDTQHQEQLLVEEGKQGSTTTTSYLTLTGTVKRGRHKGECFDVQLKMKRERLEILQKELLQKESRACCCGLRKGLHVLLLSLACCPLMWVFCTLYAFYMGTITWYNIFIHYNEQRTCCHTVFVSPCVLLLYPLWILPLTVCLGLYGGLSQISWNWAAWLREVQDPEKGFYGWICNRLALPDCAPYQVVILSSLAQDPHSASSLL